MNLKLFVSSVLIYSISTIIGYSGTGIFPHKLRAAGDSLDISIAQELSRSASIGVQWLTANQRPDGSWGQSNQLATTALCALALASQNDLALTTQLQAAITWIKTNSTERPLTNFPAIAWTTAALFAIADRPECQTEQHCQQIINSDTALSDSDNALRCEMILSLNLADPNGTELKHSQAHYARISRELEADPARMLQMWLDARVINRDGNGQLITSGNQSSDWRRIFAKKIISSQKIDPQGGGFWLGVNATPSQQNTALAILISKEL